MPLAQLHACDKYCVFQCRGCWYAILATSVREVLPRHALTRVYHADAALAGLCHVRNEFVPVVYLSDPLADIRSGDSQEEQLLVLAGPSGAWGILVDTVAGLATLDLSLSSEPSPSDSWSSVVMGSATFQDQIVQVLDANGMYRYIEGILRRYWSLHPL